MIPIRYHYKIGGNEMNLLSRDSDYAVRALCSIAKKKGLISVKDIVEESGIPYPFLRKILQKLNKSGMLVSYKGKGGGFELSKAPKNIYLTDVIRVFQGEIKINDCLFKKKLCPNRNSCILRGKILSIEKTVIKEINNITLSSLLKKRGNRNE